MSGLLWHTLGHYLTDARRTLTFESSPCSMRSTPRGVPMGELAHGSVIETKTRWPTFYEGEADRLADLARSLCFLRLDLVPPSRRCS